MVTKTKAMKGLLLYQNGSPIQCAMYTTVAVNTATPTTKN